MSDQTILRPLTRQDLAHRAEEIIGQFESLRDQNGLAEAQSEVWERFVEHEADADLRRFSEAIADARRQATIQRQLDDDRDQLHHGHLEHEGRVQVGHHYETLRREACVYNHLLRGVIDHHRGELHRPDLTTWLTRASLGVQTWAVAEVTGATSETALHAALMGLPELRGVRYATVDEDLDGYDFVAFWQGAIVTLDAKTGLYRPLAARKHGHRHLEISVPREAVADFALTKHGLDVLRHEVRQGLHIAYGTHNHASHHHYPNL